MSRSPTPVPVRRRKGNTPKQSNKEVAIGAKGSKSWAAEAKSVAKKKPKEEGQKKAPEETRSSHLGDGFFSFFLNHGITAVVLALAIFDEPKRNVAYSVSGILLGVVMIIVGLIQGTDQVKTSPWVTHHKFYRDLSRLFLPMTGAQWVFVDRFEPSNLNIFNGNGVWTEPTSFWAWGAWWGEYMFHIVCIFDFVAHQLLPTPVDAATLAKEKNKVKRQRMEARNAQLLRFKTFTQTLCTEVQTVKCLIMIVFGFRFTAEKMNLLIFFQGLFEVFVPHGKIETWIIKTLSGGKMTRLPTYLVAVLISVFCWFRLSRQIGMQWFWVW